MPRHLALATSACHNTPRLMPCVHGLLKFSDVIVVVAGGFERFLTATCVGATCGRAGGRCTVPCESQQHNGHTRAAARGMYDRNSYVTWYGRRKTKCSSENCASVEERRTPNLRHGDIVEQQDTADDTVIRVRQARQRDCVGVREGRAAGS